LAAFLEGLAKSTAFVMPVPDQVRDDASGIQNALELLNSGFRHNEKSSTQSTFCESVFSFSRKKRNESPK
jgi:hypothetical protein